MKRKLTGRAVALPGLLFWWALGYANATPIGQFIVSGIALVLLAGLTFDLWVPAVSRLWRDERGQDLVEYALIAGFLAAAATAIMPGVATSIRVVFTKINAAIYGVTYMTPPPQVVAEDPMTTMIRVIAASLTVLFLGMIVLRRRKQADD